MPRVEVVGPNGERGSVESSELPAILAQNGRALTPDELKEEQYGGVGGAIGAAAVGALDTATMGGFTAANAQVGKWMGKQAEVEQSIRSLKETNPIAHALGSAAPLMLSPEFGGEEAVAKLIQREGAAADIARFTLPHLAKGIGESAWIEGAQGISEDVLDHDLSAESFYAHALKPETLYGGLLNVGVATGFKGLGKLTSAFGKRMAGRAGEVVANDASSIDDVIAAVQRAGGTSQDANAAIAKVQEMANQRSMLPKEQRSALDKVVEPYIKYQVANGKESASVLTRMYRDGAKALEVIDDELSGYAKQADGHMTSLINDLTTLEDARLNLKFQEIKRNADPAALVQAHDAANSWIKELRATLEPPPLPPEPAPLEAHYKRVLKEWKAQGVKPPQDPAEVEAFQARAKAFAEASHASETEAYQQEVSRLMSERESLVDPEIRKLYGDPATRVGFSTKDHGKLMSLLNDVQREVNAGRKMGGAEGVARIYTALDDSRSILGHMAKFGKLTSDSAKMLERYVYNNRLRPLLEDSNVWGSRLADLQASNNETVTHSIQAIGQMKAKFFGALDNVNGQPVYVPNGNTKAFVSALGQPDAANEYAEAMVRRVTESARARGAAMLRTMDLPPDVRAAVMRAQTSASELEKLLDKAKATATDAREIKALKAREAEKGGHGIIGSLAATAASSIAGPAAGALVGAGSVAYNIVKNPTRTLEWIGQFRQAEMKARSLFTKESKSFIGGEKVPVVKPMLNEAERKAAIQSIQDIQRYQTDPRALAVTIKEQLGDMVDATPHLATALATTVARGVLALAKRAPQPLPPRFQDKPGEVRYANGELEKYWRNKQLVERPPVVMQLMRSGQLHQEDIQLMQEVVPRLFAQMQTQLEIELIEAKRAGKLRTMSYQEQIGLSWMLGRPLDQTQDPSFVSAMQQTAANDPMNQAAFGKSAMGGGRPSRLENINLERYSTLQEKLEA